MEVAPGEDIGRLLADIFTERQVVDLSVPLAENLPCTWPGHMPFRATVWSWFADQPGDPQPVRAQVGGGYQTRWLVIDEHAGTHMDAPRHFVPPPGSGLPNAGPAGEIGIDKLPLLAGVGPAVVVDVSDNDEAPDGVSPEITREYLREWEKVHGPIGSGDVVLLRSGWDSRYVPGPAGDRYGSDVVVSQTTPGWPAPTPEAIGWLHDRGVRCVGTDGFSIGPADDGGPTHLAGLTRGMAFVEALSGLGRLPTRGAWFLFLPIRLVDGTGGPGRAIAVLPSDSARIRTEAW